MRIGKDKTNPQARASLAAAYKSAGNTSKALETLRLAVKDFPQYAAQFADVAKQLGLVQLSASMGEDMKKHYEPGPELKEWSQMAPASSSRCPSGQGVTSERVKGVTPEHLTFKCQKLRCDPKLLPPAFWPADTRERWEKHRPVLRSTAEGGQAGRTPNASRGSTPWENPSQPC